jgi:hypothetical protein
MERHLRHSLALSEECGGQPVAFSHAWPSTPDASEGQFLFRSARHSF